MDDESPSLTPMCPRYASEASQKKKDANASSVLPKYKTMYYMHGMHAGLLHLPTEACLTTLY